MAGINIWALKKDQSIRHLLLLLVAQLGEGSFVVDDTTPCDERAIFLHHRQDRGIRAYIYTLGQADDRYGVHLEYPPTADAGNQLEVMENQRFEALVESLAVHFDIPFVEPLPGR
ncbi:hypothetical protein GCM10011352_34670 [Marinobacterium zhoushanense]|uniref:Uncharacterized protein n=1 Tax=Marinobacterium zhoushanense TaxID=1679163 RepID=A0ABQ1KRZ0_9GAMM|nr:hypothetical protein [Marinobacterium zhoushanense]GGC05543.1 hypothetical protein GCM10011352_34670 [Marinobacterium zhoushanense]